MSFTDMLPPLTSLPLHLGSASYSMHLSPHTLLKLCLDGQGLLEGQLAGGTIFCLHPIRNYLPK